MGNEASIEQQIILPLLQQWGYQPSEWQAKPRVANTYPDFLIRLPMAGGANLTYLVIEVKSDQQPIAVGQQQLQRYMTLTRAVFGLLTNGSEYALFYQNPLSQPLRPTLCSRGTLDGAATEQLSRVLHRSVATTLVRTLTQQSAKVYSRFEQVLARQFSMPTTSAKEPSMIITVFNNKGGVGKTTLTLNLGAAFASRGKRVLLIDIDAQSNLTMGLGIDPLTDVEEQGRKDIVDLLLRPKTTLEDVVYKKSWGDLQLDIIPSHIRLADKEPDLVSRADIDRVLQRKLRDHPYDVVLIDPPPAFSKVNSIALMASEFILVPIHLAPYPIRALEYVLSRLLFISEVIERPPQLLGIAVSRYDPRSSRVNDTMLEKAETLINEMKTKYEELKTFGNLRLLPMDTWVSDRAVINTAVNLGLPIYSFDFYQKISYGERQAADQVRSSFDSLAQCIINLTRYHLGGKS